MKGRMTTNFKEFSAMVNQLIRAVDYITPEEECAMMAFIGELQLKNTRFKFIENNRETTVALGGVKSGPFRAIAQDCIEKVDVYLDKNDGHLEVGVVLTFNFEVTQPFVEQFNNYIANRTREFSVWDMYKKYRQQKIMIMIDGKMMITRIIFERT
jgi:hypothetical protein